MELLEYHEWCTSDPIVIPAYREGIMRLVKPGDVVADLGAGAGILSYLACSAGAVQSHAIESSDAARLIPAVAAANGLADRVIVHNAMSYDVEIPGRADVVLASMVDSFGIDRGLLDTIIDARARLLKPGGAVMPASMQLEFCPTEMPGWYEGMIEAWDTARAGFTFRDLKPYAVNQRHAMNTRREWLLAAPARFDRLDFLTVQTPNVYAEKEFVVDRAGVFHGFAGWFNVIVVEGVRFGNSPFDPDRVRWRNSGFPVASAVPVLPGDRILGSLRLVSLNRDLTWIWTAKVVNSAGVLRAHFHHSSFNGVIFGKKELSTLAKS